MREFKRLKALEDGDWMEFSYNKEPKCPHCGDEFNIQDNEAWSLYDENGPHTVECVTCGNDFQVSSHANWSFSTDEQEDTHA